MLLQRCFITKIDASMRNLIFLFVVFVLCSCNTNTNSTNDQTPKSWKETVMVIPDDQATPEELKLKNKMFEVMSEVIAVKNNGLVITVDKKYFTSQGIPEAYYDLLEAEFEETNRALEKMVSEQNVDLTGAVEQFKVDVINHIKQLATSK